jgi:transposase
VSVKQIRDKVAGLDVHRDSVVACARVLMPDGTIEVDKQRFATTQRGLASLTGFLVDAGVNNTVAMEATGVYWRAAYYALEGLFPELWLCNAQHVKNVPGRKSDLSDAEWLADVAAHGMVRPSLVHRLRSGRCVSSPVIARHRSMPEPRRSSVSRRCSRTLASSSPLWPRGCGRSLRGR